MIGADRAFNYDASVTMQNFVTGSVGDVFTRQTVYNNHPLLSLVEHVVSSVTGSVDESTMRFAPALFAASAVGILTWRVAARWGLAAGIVGGVLLATHPTLTSQRDVRGYTLAVLAIVLMGVAVLDIGSPALFAVALAVGVGTHVYAAIPAAALLVFLWSSGALTSKWRLAGAVGFVAGLACYAGMIHEMGRKGRVFRPRFPIDAGWELLGGGIIAAIALSCLLLLALRQRPPTPILLGAAVTSLGVFGPWLLAPVDLYPRFVYYAVPALALAASAAVKYDRRLFIVGFIAAVAMLAPSLRTWTHDELPNRQLAQVARGRVCGVGYPVEALRWYKPDIVVGTDCPVVAILRPEAIQKDAATARVLWPALCWSVPSAELRARTSQECPVSPRP